jgi:galactose-1-phosphate uridylyltransferase
MSFLRFDQTTSDWVIFAPSRARRPDEFRQRRPVPEPDLGSIAGCPFCPGNESRTPAEIYAERSAGGSPSQCLRNYHVPPGGADI